MSIHAVVKFSRLEKIRDMINMLKGLNRYFKVVLTFVIGAAFLFSVENCASFGSRGKRNYRSTEKLSVPPRGGKWGPPMKYVEGGYIYLLGGVGSPFRIDRALPRGVTVSSFYISEFPITNRLYLYYLDDLKRSGKMKEYKKAMPDTKAWKNKFSANDSLANYPYARSFLDYPAVCLCKEQCENYCKWLTEKEKSLRNKNNKPSKSTKKSTDDAKPLGKNKSDKKMLDADVTKMKADGSALEKEETPNADAVDGEHGPKEEKEKDHKDVLKKENSTEDEEEDGEEEDIEPLDEESLNAAYEEMIQKATGDPKYEYRLPTEAELEFAYKATQANQKIVQGDKGEKRIIEPTMIGDYGNGESSIRIQEGENTGKPVGLFKRYEGNFKGVAGEESDDDSDAPTQMVYNSYRNGLGITSYGNVFVWCRDEFRLDSARIYIDRDPLLSDASICDADYDRESPLSQKCSVIYGGSFSTCPQELRLYMNDEDCAPNVGFRIVASIA